MKLRCMFAAHALSILGAEDCITEPKSLASYCWDVSDEMIKEMERRKVQWREKKDPQ